MSEATPIQDSGEEVSPAITTTEVQLDDPVSSLPPAEVQAVVEEDEQVNPSPALESPTTSAPTVPATPITPATPATPATATNEFAHAALKKFKLVFLGEQSVGKTSLITRFM